MAERHLPLHPVRPAPRLIEVYSGYVLTRGSTSLEVLRLREGLMRFGGALAGIGAAALWLLPVALRAAAGNAVIAALSCALAILAGLLILRAKGPTCREVRIDLIHCEVTRVIRPSGGCEREIMRVHFSEIGGLLLRAALQPGDDSALYMKKMDEDELICLAVGRNAELEAIRARIARDLDTFRRSETTPPREAVARIA